MRRAPRRGVVGERGAALAGVILVGALIGALGLVLAFSVWSRLASARYARDDAEALYIARAVVEASAGWFEYVERGAIVPPPGVGELTRQRRAADGDLYKAGGGALFRPPDGPATEHRLLGTHEVPDLLLERGGRGESKLDAMMAALGAPPGLELVRVSFFAPPHAAAEGTLASVECVVEIRRAGMSRRRVALRAEVWRVPWDSLARPLVIAGDAQVRGAAAWRFGEAWVGGDLESDAATEASWPSSMPWVGPDEPLLDDHDGDGVNDDVDGDGSPDLQAWREAPGTVEDPWWRARIGGSWSGLAGSGCKPARPFGPRDAPPRPVERESERSAILVGCAPLGIEALPASWRIIGSLRGRGVIRARESSESPGLFLPAWGGAARATSELLPPSGALLILDALPGSVPLELSLGGGLGGLVVRGRSVLALPGAARSHPARVPADPRSTAGALRAPSSEDLLSPLAELGAPCSGWSPGRWRAPAGTERGARDCPDRPLHHAGLLATDAHLELAPGLRIAGQVRAGSLTLRGGALATVVEARPEGFGLDQSRPGPPGAPRVAVRGVRRERH